MSAGMVKQFGDVGVSLTTLTISLSTFFLIVFELTSTSGFRLSIAGGALACIWLFLILIITIPFASYPRGESYYGISG